MKRSLRLYETWPNKPTLNIRALFNWGPVLSRGVFFFGSDTIGQMFETIRPGSSLEIIYFSLNIFKFKTTNKSKQRHVASVIFMRKNYLASACSIFSIDRENTMNDKSALKPAIFLHSAHLKCHQRDVSSHFKFMYQIHAT